MSKRIKVLLSWHSLVVAGYQKYVNELAQYPDLDITVLIPPGWIEGGKYVPAHKSQDPRYKMLIGQVFNKNYLDTFFYWQTPRYLHQIQPDIIHLFEEPWSNCVALFLFFKRFLAPGSKFIFQTFQNLNLKYSRSYEWVEKTTFQNTDCALACSNEIKEVLLARGFNKRIEIVPIGADPAVYYPQQKERSEKLVFGYIGRLVPEKGLDLLIKAFASLKDHAQLVIIGSGPKLNELMALAQALNCSQQITWIAAIDQQQMPEAINKMDVLVLPSLTTPLWKEQFGRVLVEAMLSKVAVIGSSSGEIPYVIGEGGLVFPEGDTKALGEQMKKLLDDPALLESLRVKGYERAKNNYTWEIAAKKTYQVYKSLWAASTTS